MTLEEIVLSRWIRFNPEKQENDVARWENPRFGCTLVAKEDKLYVSDGQFLYAPELLQHSDKPSGPWEPLIAPEQKKWPRQPTSETLASLASQSGSVGLGHSRQW